MGTKNDYWTKAVAEQGLSALEQRRQQNPYDSTDWQQSANWILDNPYAATSPTDGYQQFQQLSGMNDPTGYAISYGRTGDGKYAGYKTSGDLWNAVEGNAVLQQQEDRAKAQAMSQLLNEQLDQIQNDYTKNYQWQPSEWDKRGVSTSDGGLGRAHMPAMPGMDPSRAPSEQLSDQEVERNKMMNLWLAQASDPYMSGLDTMDQIQRTPIHDYKIQAGMRLGIDPALVQGRFDPQTQVSDFLTNRNLEAINNYGSTYSDYNAALSDIQRQADSQSQDAVKQQQIQVENFVADATGKDPRSVADDSNMTIEQVAAKLQDTNYLKAAPLVQQAALAGDVEQLHQLLDPLREVDDQLWRLLQVQYSEYLPSDWDPNG